MTHPGKLFIGYLMFILSGLNAYALTPAENTDLESQCRQEADSFGIPPEQLEEYIDGCLLSRGGSLSSAPEESASIEAQCHQEAKDYQIAPEQQAEYINGCISSLGGSVTPAPVVEESEEPNPVQDELNPDGTLEDRVDVQ